MRRFRTLVPVVPICTLKILTKGVRDGFHHARRGTVAIAKSYDVTKNC